MAVHISVDIETMGVRSNAAILSIGAVVFDPFRPSAPEFSFYQRVDLESCLKVWFTVDASTISWWAEQDQAARAVMRRGGVPLPNVLCALSGWLTARTWDGSPLRLWCHGPSFDAVVLENAYRACGITTPWKHNDPRDTRTIFDAAGLDFATFPRVGTYHNALDDAETQARAVQEAYRMLGARA